MSKEFEKKDVEEPLELAGKVRETEAKAVSQISSHS
jgi:hypothetical protein